jgi:hypothetical protein
MGSIMNAYIAAFMLIGVLFGLGSFSNRHLFSEGPTRTAEGDAAGATFGARLFWVMVCTFLWPVMVLAGLNSAWILARRKRQVSR